MLNDSWWSLTLFPAVFCAPWVACIVWVCSRTQRGDDTPAPSMGERARRRLDLG
jgi:hypothetical protein